MALIDPDGMFGGDRMALLSDEAKLHWPWFWCASNTVARIELDYHKVMARAYRQFTKKPTEDKFWALAGEYQKAYLMYVYEREGQIWGQWDTSDKYLQRHKLTADLRSPAPSVREFADFKNQYIEDKKTLASRKFSVINNFRNFRKPSESSQGGVRGVGVGVGVGGGVGGGEEENLCAAAAAPEPELPSLLPSLLETKRPQKIWFDEQHDRWYSGYWCHQSKAASRKAFEKRVCVIHDRDKLSYNAAVEFLIAMARDDQQRFEPTEDWDWRQNLHPATWLNQERWRDEAKARGQPARQEKSFVNDVTRVIQERLERGDAPW